MKSVFKSFIAGVILISATGLRAADEYHGLGIVVESGYLGPSYSWNAGRNIEFGVRALANKLFTSDDYLRDEVTYAQVGVGATAKIPIGSVNFRPLGLYPGFYYTHINGDGEIEFALNAPFLNISLANESAEFVLGPSFSLRRDGASSIYTVNLLSAEIRLLF